ncbi:MAG: oligosaccharide flippase family protein [Clostridia bacterium]|nr:oligosaccharide flippase family protein [Clostridia bacterium]
MEQESRKKILIRNTQFGAVKTIIQYLLQFVLRTIFIYVLGKEYLGLNGLFANILGCLSIVELGVGTAIVFSMYKPIVDQDIEKIKSLNALYKKSFRIIALIILCLGVAIMPLLKVLIKSDIPTDINIYIIYAITLFNTVLGYLWAHNRALLFAYQRSDIESKIGILQILLISVSQIVLLLTTKNYYAYIICAPIFTIVENLLLSRSVKKVCPNLKGKVQKLDKDTTKEIKRNIVASSMTQIGGVFVTSTDNILISSILGLAILGVYTNYATIILSITACIALVTNNARSTIGNLIASKSSDYVYEKYKIFNFIMYWLTGFCAICLLCLSNPFILLWTKGATDYLLTFSVVVVLIINFYISNTLSLTATFNVSAGLMWHNKWKTIVQGLVNLVFSILFARWWGIIGIFLGTLASYVATPLWLDSHVLYKHYFKKNITSYWIKYILFTLITLLSAVICLSVCGLIPFGGLTGLVLKGLICLAVPNIIYLLCFFKTEEFKECLNLIKNFINKKRKQDM